MNDDEFILKEKMNAKIVYSYTLKILLHVLGECAIVLQQLFTVLALYVTLYVHWKRNAECQC